MSSRASLDINDVAQDRWDVIVVGAGPSGAMTAREIALLGAHVLLVDRAAFPRNKVCGCCLNSRATRVLHDADLGAVLDTPEASPLHDFRLTAKGRTATVALGAGGVALSRWVLDDALVRAAIDAGVVFFDETMVHVDAASSGYRALRLATRQAEYIVEARIVVAADGLSQGMLRELDDQPVSPQANSHIGAGAMFDDSTAEFEEGTIYMACGSGGYVGLVRLGNGQLNVAAALNAECVREKGGLAQAAHSILAEAGCACPSSLDDAQWRGTPPLTRRASTLSGHRFFVVGDAAGYVEPFTGEGMAWALTAAKALAPLAFAGAKEFDSELIGRWSSTQKRLVSRSQRRCRLIAAGLRRPHLVGLAVDMLRCAPQLAAPLVRQLNGPSNIETEC